jgi:hypothetical protein
MKCTRGARFDRRLDKVMNENIVAEFTYKIEHKQMVDIDLTTGCQKQ